MINTQNHKKYTYMNNPQLADKIVGAMIQLCTSDSARISKHINEPHESVKDMMKYLLSSQPGEFYSTKGGYGDSIDIGIRPAKEGFMKEFVTQGGYTKREKDIAEIMAKNNKLKDIQIEYGSLAISKANKADLKSWIALGISLATIIFEVFKYLRSK